MMTLPAAEADKAKASGFAPVPPSPELPAERTTRIRQRKKTTFRHKALDAIGDLSLAGLPILGRYRSVRGGHRLNAMVVAALIADGSAATVVQPSGRRERGHAGVGVPAAVPAYGADLS